MLGFGKNAKAKAAALQVVKQVITVSTMYRTPTSAFWRDPYVLGALYGLIISTSRYAVGGTLEAMAQGQIVFDVLGEVTGEDGLALGRIGVSLMQSQEPSFVLAARRAATLSDMMFRQSITEMSLDVEEAMQRAKAMKEVSISLGSYTTEVAAVINELYAMWLTEPLRDRLPEQEDR